MRRAAAWASRAALAPFEETVRSSRSLATPTVRDSIPILPATAVDYGHFYTRVPSNDHELYTLRVPE